MSCWLVLTCPMVFVLILVVHCCFPFSQPIWTTCTPVTWIRSSLGRRLMATVALSLRNVASISLPAFGAGTRATFIESVCRSWIASAATQVRRGLSWDGSLMCLVQMFAWSLWQAVHMRSGQWLPAKPYWMPVFWLALVQTLPATDCVKYVWHSGLLFHDVVYRE